jgi:hypothetical protein
MAKRRFWSVLAVSAAASVVLGGLPVAVYAATTATTAMTGGASLAGAPGFGPLTPSLTAQLSQGVDQPVIVLLKDQPAQAAVGTAGARTRSAAVSASQASLVAELAQVSATGVKQFTLVNSVAATVSPLEKARLARDPAVAAVIPDATVTIQDPAKGAAVGTAPASAAVAARSTSLPLNNIPGACAPKNKVQLAPEGLGLTRTAGGSGATTAQGLGFTGAGVKVAWIADGLNTKNANLKRKDGISVFVDYKDFTGDGPAAPTTGGEAYIDATTIAGQGRTVYNLNGFSSQTYPGTCDVVIKGVAPGASLVGLDVFSGDSSHPYVTTNSMIAEAINYAVEKDHVNVINESFGTSSVFADTANDVVRMFDDAAVKAGVVVAVSSGDSGTTSTIGSPATDPNVISVGATTQFQAYAQANIAGARYFTKKGWIDNNISAFSSGGFDQAGATVDLVAPGDLSWASCDANTAKYAECTNNRGQASAFEEAGGTSEAAPFVAGAAALVIQAYRKTHRGSPPAALVKQILLSTASDIGAPAAEQGAGLLNAYKAVQLAESVGRSSRKGSTLLVTGGPQLNDTSLPGVTKSWKVTVTNTAAGGQTVKLGARTLGHDTSVQAGHVTLSDAASNQYTGDSGAKDNYATFTFKVPAGQARLDVSIAYAADPTRVFLPPNVTLIDPFGRLAANSQPQGVGNYGNVDVSKPAAGTWKAIVAGHRKADGGYNGTVAWRAATQKYAAFGSLSVRSMSLAAGQSKSFVFAVTAPATAGDVAGSVLLSSSTGGTTTIPVTVRSLVNLAAGGTFSGVLTGGNGRTAVDQDNYYSFDVPAGAKAITARVLLANDPGVGNYVGAYLVSPDGDTLGYGQNYAFGTPANKTDKALAASVVNPASGRWTLIVDFALPIPGTEVADPFTGTVSLAPGVTVAAGALPATIAKGTTFTLPVTITNNTGAPQDFFFDARLTASGSVTLAPVTPSLTAGSNTSSLPLSQNAAPSFYFVPSHTAAVGISQVSTVPATTELNLVTGDPDFAATRNGSLCAKSAAASYKPSGGVVTIGEWATDPTECGPFQSLGKAGKATDKVTVTTRDFDNQVSAQWDGVTLGDFMKLALGATAAQTFMPVELGPGKSAIVNVLIKPTATAGSEITGTLYLDDLQSALPPLGVPTASEVTGISYAYKVG